MFLSEVLPSYKEVEKKKRCYLTVVSREKRELSSRVISDVNIKTMHKEFSDKCFGRPTGFTSGWSTDVTPPLGKIKPYEIHHFTLL